MARSRSSRTSVGVGWIVTWPLTIVFGAMIFLCAEKLRQTKESEAAQTIDPASLGERIDKLTWVLQHSSLGLPRPEESQAGSGAVRHVLRIYRLSLKPEQQGETELAVEALRGAVPGIEIAPPQPTSSGFDVNIGLDGLLTHQINFEWVQENTVIPRLSLVVTDLGDDLLMTRQCANLDVAVVLAVKPQRPFSKEVAELARLFQKDLYVYLPLRDTPGEDFAVNVNEEVSPQIDAALAAVPGAVGIVIDPGAVLEGPPVDTLVINLKTRNLPWLFANPVSGRTSPPENEEVVGALVGGEGVSGDALTAQLSQVVAKARQSGFAVAAITASVASVDAVKRAVENWQQEGVQVVPYAALLSAPVTAQPTATPAAQPAATRETEEIPD